MILAVIGSYSSLQGLLIWPVGLLLLYQRNRSRRMLLTWLACAVVAVGVYFYKSAPPVVVLRRTCLHIPYRSEVLPDLNR